jgi:hypothetical protein
MPKMDHSQCHFKGRAENGSARFRCPRQAMLPWRRNDAPFENPQGQALPPRPTEVPAPRSPQDPSK